MSFSKSCGRVSVEISDEGLRMHGYGHGVSVSCIAGWNDSCPKVAHTMSVDELRDLRYMVDRAIEAAMAEASSPR